MRPLARATARGQNTHMTVFEGGGEPPQSPGRCAIGVQFIHGLEGSPQGRKAQVLAQTFNTVTPTMDTSDFEGCVVVQRDALRRFQPEVLVGSSFGGAVAVALLARGLWRGPTLLLAQAAVRYGHSALPPDVPVLLVHGQADEIIDPQDSRALASTGTPSLVRLLEVADDHSLRASVEAGHLVEWVKQVHRMVSQ